MSVIIDGSNGITTPLDVEIQGSTSGSIVLAAPAVAGTNTITLPASTGTVALTSNVIGVGQTWQNLTGSRIAGTTYTNSTGKPIAVSIYSNSTTNGTIIVSGVTVTQTNVSVTPLQAIIPVGATYATGGSIAITFWAELR